ncbi:acetyltransferase [Flavobacterium branchiophilum]|nr:acetyltransferase [Flavobacterium branchiophilum]
MGTKKMLYGASGHAKVIIDILCCNNYQINGILDDFSEEKYLYEIPIYKPNIYEISNNTEFLITIGDNTIRKNITSQIFNPFFNAIHPKSIISRFSKIGNGTAIMANVVINADVTIGDHCIINSSSIIEHECIIGNYVHISPNACLAGNVSVGEGSHIGIGASIIPNIKIGKWAKIGAGAVIIQDVPDFACVVGNPGKIIKFLNP